MVQKYLPTATLLAGVKAEELHQGHFNANQYNYLEGSVQVPAFTKPVLLIGRENMNRAVNGDVVVIEVFDKKEWKAPADEVVDQDGKRVLIFLLRIHVSGTSIATLKNDDAEDSGEEGEEENDEVLVKESRHIQSEKRTSEKQPTARIVGIIKRNWRAYVILRFIKHDCTFKKLFLVTYVISIALHSLHRILHLFPNKPSLQHLFQGSFLASDYAPAKHPPLSVRKSLSPSIDGMSPHDILRATLCVH